MNHTVARVLIVDDCKHVRGFLETVLKSEGVNVTCASSGAEAIELCKSSQFDLMFMDMRMPEMDGLATMRAIREFDTETPALALTADDREKIDDEDSPFEEFLGKPIDRKALIQLVEKYHQPSHAAGKIPVM